VIELGHFTAAELPGTVAICAAGIGIGFALAISGVRAATIPFALLASMAALSMLADTSGWAETVRIGIDAAFLVGALAALRWCAAGSWPSHAARARGASPAGTSNRPEGDRRAA
jgi:hypothetical protein